MDYTKVPRTLIYKDRDDLKDFGVQVPGTMNNLLFSNLKELFKATDKLKELILRCFNNAYYICTIIPFEDFPDTQVAEYEKLLLKDDPYDCEEVCAVSMAMVCKLLPASDIRWMPENSDLIKQIRYRFTHYQWMHSGARDSFEFMEGKHNTDELIISPSEFVPRDIIEVIENCSLKDLKVYAEYICERLVHLKVPRQRMYGADMAIARINDYQRELCEDCGYNPKKDCFKHTVDYDPLRDLSWENNVRGRYQQSKEAINYYKEHYPPKKENDSKEQTVESAQSSEAEAPQMKIRKQDSSQSEPSNSEIAQLQGRIKELQEALDKEKAKTSRLEEKIVNRLQINSDEFEKTKRRNETLESLNQANEKRLKTYESILGTEEQLSKEKQFSITERIIFCSALLGCSLSEDGISQMQMAKLISRFSGDKHEAIRTTINKINKKLKALVEVAEKAKQEKDAGARDSIWRVEGEKYIGITNAALNVYKFLHAAVKGQTIGAKVHYCQQAMENINQAYYLSERKLINKTDWQPKGDFELPPEEI